MIQYWDAVFEVNKWTHQTPVANDKAGITGSSPVVSFFGSTPSGAGEIARVRGNVGERGVLGWVCLTCGENYSGRPEAARRGSVLNSSQFLFAGAFPVNIGTPSHEQGSPAFFPSQFSSHSFEITHHVDVSSFTKRPWPTLQDSSRKTLYRRHHVFDSSQEPSPKEMGRMRTLACCCFLISIVCSTISTQTIILKSSENSSNHLIARSNNSVPLSKKSFARGPASPFPSTF